MYKGMFHYFDTVNNFQKENPDFPFLNMAYEDLKEV